MTERDQIQALYSAMNNDKPCPHGEVMDAILERQDKLQSAHDHFTHRIDRHMEYEDEFKKEMTDRFKAGDDRMVKIEGDISALSRLADAFEGFKKALNMIGWISGAVLALFMWILLEKNADIKATQETLVKHAITLEKMVGSHQELERDMRREFDRLEKNRWAR